MLNRFIASFAVIVCFGTPALSADLNLQDGEWELDMKADIFGSPMNEYAKECTTPEDLTKNAYDFVTEMLADTGCRIGTSSYSINLFQGTLICPSDTTFSDGEFSIQHSPTMLAMIVELNSTGNIMGKPMKMSMLSQRIGACPTQ